MPHFDYEGRFSAGGGLTGTIEANSPAEATATLERLGVQVHTVRPTRGAAYFMPLTLDEFTFFNEQLSVLTRAGVPLDEGLRQLAQDVGSRRLRRLFVDLADELHAGTSLETALEKHRRRFPPGYGAVVSAGVQTGDVSGVLYSVIAASRRTTAFRQSLTAALAYPLTVLLLTWAVLSFVMRTVLPQLEGAFRDMVASGIGRGVSVYQEVVFSIARMWSAVDLTLALMLVLLVLVVMLLALRPLVQVRDAVLRSVPGIRGMYRNSALARFTHVGALAALRTAPLPDLLRTAGAACGSSALRGAAERLAGQLEQGIDLSSAAERESALPPIWVMAVRVAGPRGDLPGVLADLARHFEESAERAAQLLRIVLAPLIFGVAIVVLLGVAGVILTVVAELLRGLTWF